MNIFSTILQKLGIGKASEEVKAAPSAEVTAAEAAADAARVQAMAKATQEAKVNAAARTVAPGAIPAAPKPTRPAAISVVDVVAKLETLSKAHPELDWKVSIVDLLKLLEIDSGFTSRKDLAIELGCPADTMADSARMNVWLHKTVLQKIADNGGNIPANLLD